MRTIQMTIDEPLLEQVDQIIANLHTTRSEFIRAALKLALEQHRITQLEQQHAQGYAQQPMAGAEIADWEDVRDWGDA